VGDVIIGRIISVEKKLWRVNLNAQREGILNLTAINLPQGEQRIRNEEDQMSMRIYFKENDLLSGEIQQITQNGNIHIQTRNLKYGKLKNGILVKVNHSLIKKKKHQFIEIVYNIKIILALNGYCWIYYSTVKIEDEYFSDDKNKIDIINKEEKIDEKSCILIILIRNIIKNIDEAEIEIKKETIIRYYELFIEMYRKNVNFDDKDSMKKLQKIDEKKILILLI
jgi:exosome complex RNA-binding protein Rrp4